MDIRQVPPGLRALVAAHGAPVDVESARIRWAALVTAAAAGSTVLITRDGYQWAALVPISEVAEISPQLPTWPVSEARAKLGRIVGEIHALDNRVHVLTKHREPIAALVLPTDLLERPPAAARIAAEQLLRDGHRVELAFKAGGAATARRNGEADQSGFYAATAYGNTGAVIATGSGPTLGEALLRLTASRQPVPGEDTSTAHR
jgi:antitoxin (DNA-binding transcriptional repressor) of toxin-antitoxin stability system